MNTEVAKQRWINLRKELDLAYRGPLPKRECPAPSSEVQAFLIRYRLGRPNPFERMASAGDRVARRVVTEVNEQFRETVVIEPAKPISSLPEGWSIIEGGGRGQNSIQSLVSNLKFLFIGMKRGHV